MCSSFVPGPGRGPRPRSAQWAPRHDHSRPRPDRGVSRRAFSLVELMAVLALMALLASIVTVSVRPLLSRGKQNAARTEISNICSALESFYSVEGRYPTNDEGLAQLAQKTERIPEPLLAGLPVDPWGRPYQYLQPGRNNRPYEVISYGADGREGGQGADADICSWNLREAPSRVQSATGN